jgi:hypothetical protein
MKNINLFFSILLIFFLSCDRNQEIKIETSEISEVEMVLKTGPGNLMNPYDTIGIIHNFLLDEYFELSNILKTSKLDSIDIEWCIMVCDTILTRNNYPTISFNAELKDIIHDMPNFFIHVLDDLHMSYNAKFLFNEMINKLKYYAISDSSDYNIFKMCIEVNELDILNSFVNEEQMLLLSFTSVLRHSLYYWANNENFEPVKGPKAIWKYLTMAVCDTFGGIAGAELGVPGIIVGAVGASAAGGDLWDHIFPPSSD